MMVCFDRMLASEWYRVAQCIRELANKNIGGVTLWNFLDFLVTQRTPLFILLLPLIRYKLLNRLSDNEQEYFYQQQIKEKLRGRKMPACRSKGQMLVTLLTELKFLKDDLRPFHSAKLQQTLQHTASNLLNSSAGGNIGGANTGDGTSAFGIVASGAGGNSSSGGLDVEPGLAELGKLDLSLSTGVVAPPTSSTGLAKSSTVVVFGQDSGEGSGEGPRQSSASDLSAIAAAAQLALPTTTHK